LKAFLQREQLKLPCDEFPAGCECVICEIYIISTSPLKLSSSTPFTFSKHEGN